MADRRQRMALRDFASQPALRDFASQPDEWLVRVRDLADEVLARRAGEALGPHGVELIELVDRHGVVWSAPGSCYRHHAYRLDGEFWRAECGLVVARGAAGIRRGAAQVTHDETGTRIVIVCPRCAEAEVERQVLGRRALEL